MSLIQTNFTPKSGHTNKLENTDEKRIKDIASHKLKEILSEGQNDFFKIMINNDVVQTLIREDSFYLKHAFDSCKSTGHTECIKMLIKMGSNIELENEFDYYVARFIKKNLGMSVNSRKDTKKKLCEAKELQELETRCPWRHPITDLDLFCKSIAENDEETFNRLLSSVKVNYISDSHYSSPIMYAAQQGRFSMMKILLGKGAPVENAKSAIMFSVINPHNFNYEHFKCTKLLLNAGANIKDIEFEPKKYFLTKLVKEIMKEKENRTSITQ